MLPEECLLGWIIGMPILILVARGGMQVEDGVNLVVSADLDHPVKLFKAGLTNRHRVHIVFKMAIIKRQAHQIQAQRANEARILLGKKIFEIAFE